MARWLGLIFCFLFAATAARADLVFPDPGQPHNGTGTPQAACRYVSAGPNTSKETNTFLANPGFQFYYSSAPSFQFMALPGVTKILVCSTFMRK